MGLEYDHCRPCCDVCKSWGFQLHSYGPTCKLRPVFKLYAVWIWGNRNFVIAKNSADALATLKKEHPTYFNAIYDNKIEITIEEVPMKESVVLDSYYDH